MSLRDSYNNMRKLSAAIGMSFWLIFILPLACEAERRAVWIRPFINAGESIRSDEAKSRDYVRNELAKMKRAGFDSVFVETFWDGYTIYPSAFTPQRPLSIQYGTAQNNGHDFDVLQMYLDEAAKVNLKVHAWLHIFHQWNTNLGAAAKSPIFSRHPDWIALDQNNSPNVVSEAEGARQEIFKVFISPSNTEARKFLIDIVRELTENYPNLAGAQWDYIRYPLHNNQQNFDFSADALARFLRDTHLNARDLKDNDDKAIWQEWKTRQVTKTVEEFNKIVRANRPNWEISVAVFPGFENTLKVKMQDSRNWAKKGYINAFYPMCYSPNFEKVEASAKEFRGDIKPPMKVFLTLYVTHFYKDGVLDERFLNQEKKYGYDGLAIFASQLITDYLAGKLAGK